MQDARCLKVNYDRSVLLISYEQVVCCDVFFVPLHYVNGKLLFFFFSRGAPFLVCIVLFSVLSRRVFSFSVEDR